MIPESLRAKDRFVLWRSELRGGKATKVPKTLRGGNASTTNQNTWCTFNDALAALQLDRDGNYSGLGYVLDADEVGIDFDNSRDPMTGEFAEWAREHIAKLQTYGDVSQSQRGVKFIARGKLPGRSFNTPIKGVTSDEEYRVEMYDASSARFFALTGATLIDRPTDVQNDQAGIEAIYAAFSKKPAKAPRRIEVEHFDPIAVEGSSDPRLMDRAWAYIQKMPDAISGKGGHNATFSACCVCYRFGLTDSAALEVMQKFNAAKTGGEEWTNAEIVHKLTGARKAVEKSGEFAELARPFVEVSVDEHITISATERALSADPNLFQRGGQLVTVSAPDRVDSIRRSEDAPVIRAIPPANLRERITRFSRPYGWKVDKETGETVPNPTNPPAWLVSGLHERGEWPSIRELIAVSDVPILRADGSVCSKAGFDTATGVMLRPSRTYPAITSSPTLDDARASAGRLIDLYCDFPFVSDAHRSAQLSAVLTPAARHAFNGPAPLFVHDANIRGSGKSLSVDIAAIVNTGRPVAVSSWSHDTEELRKKITTAIMCGDRMINFDNCEGKLGNDVLDRVLTGTRWKDRVLGANRNIDLPISTVFFASGNNVSIGADTVRRVIHVRLEVMAERPEDRSGFKYPNLREHVTRNHPSYLADALTVLSAYIRAGKPSMNLRPFGSFEGWSDLVRSAVVWCGYADPCETREYIAEHADETGDILGDLLTAWIDYTAGSVFVNASRGIVIKDLVARLYAPCRPSDPASEAMRSAIEALVNLPAGKTPTARQVSNRLKVFRRRVSNGRYLDLNGRGRDGAEWKVFESLKLAA